MAATAQMTSRGNLVPVLRKTRFEPSTYFNERYSEGVGS
jgi:hypothetical protein